MKLYAFADRGSVYLVRAESPARAALLLFESQPARHWPYNYLDWLETIAAEVRAEGPEGIVATHHCDE